MDRDPKKSESPLLGVELEALRDANRASAHIPPGMLDKLRNARTSEAANTPEISVLKIPNVMLGVASEPDAEPTIRTTIPWEAKGLAISRAEQTPTEADSTSGPPNDDPPAKPKSTPSEDAVVPAADAADTPVPTASTAKPHRQRSDSVSAREAARKVPPPAWYQSLAPARDDRPIQDVCQRILTQFPRQSHAQLLFASADPTVSTNRTVGKIATTFAQASSGDVLLVDANWEANVPIAKNRDNPQTGLAEVLGQGLDWRPLVVTTQTEGLRVLPCGAADVPARQITSDALLKLAAEWRRDFEFVLINAGFVKQLLTRRLAICCDGAYIMVQLNQTTKADALAATRILAENKARTMGAIVFDSARDS